MITITVDEDGCRLEGTTKGDLQERACSKGQLDEVFAAVVWDLLPDKEGS